MKRSDEEIKKDIVDQLFWDDRVNASKITVDVEDGEVTLKGSVPNYSARLAASTDTWVVSGVLSVNNDIEIEYAETDVSYVDSQLNSYIMNVLKWNPNIDSSEISVSVDNGWVTIEGSVDALWKKMRAEDLISDIAGVLGVTNKLSVVPTKDIMDELIAEDIVSALERNASLNVEDIDVKVENGTVTLSGSVSSWSARMAAYEAALYTEGVTRIHDDLQVSSAA
jgi:osmotically-inducible protein OsmY